MTAVFLFLWIVSALLIILERRTVRIIIYLGVFALISSVCFFMFAAPDVAMAEIVISSFITIFFIVCLERYYDLGTDEADTRPPKHMTSAMIRKSMPPLFFTAGLFVLFIVFMPGDSANSHLKDRYLALFQNDIGGINAVSSIYLGYRVYDTLFESLMLLVGVMAVAHLSWYQSAADGKREHLDSKIALPVIRIVSPLMLLFGIYLIANGHLSPGGGFQGGVVISAFFICRYLLFDIQDINVDRLISLEKLVFAGVVVFAALFIFVGIDGLVPLPKETYLILMNALVGVKVATGFTIVLYRFIAFERR